MNALIFDLVEDHAHAGENSVCRDLGDVREYPGTLEQARELSQLIGKAPGRLSYALKFHARGITCHLLVDFKQEKITRYLLHSDSAPFVVVEEWHGHAGFRLLSALAGQSLNDTPGGKSGPHVLHLDANPGSPWRQQ